MGKRLNKKLTDAGIINAYAQDIISGSTPDKNKNKDPKEQIRTVKNTLEDDEKLSTIKNDIGQTEENAFNEDDYEKIDPRAKDPYSHGGEYKWGAAFSEQTDKVHTAQITNLQDIALYLPSWGYTDYMIERMNWQKGLNNVGGEPGWFYFRIFFHFNTRYGLFGGMLKDENGATIANGNNAKIYYKMWAGHYKSLGMEYRAKSLEFFVRQLNNISNKTPWFFKSITGLDKAQITSLTEPFKDNTFEIKCSEESIDMRLTTLFDYYKFACFDYVNLKEILPENLRKFDMSVVVYGVPIRYLDTHSKINGKEYKARTINEISNMMTMKMFTFKDCEFDIENMTTGINSDISNETAFELGKNNSIKIKYKKVFNYHQNGFSNIILSDLGMFNQFNSDVASRFKKMSDAFNYMKYASNAIKTANEIVNDYIPSKTKFSKWYKFARNGGVGNAYKALIDETEAICQDYYNNILNYTFNNLVGDKLLHSAEIGYIIPQDKIPGGDWWKEQITIGKHGFPVPPQKQPSLYPLSSNSTNKNNAKPTLKPIDTFKPKENFNPNINVGGAFNNSKRGGSTHTNGRQNKYTIPNLMPTTDNRGLL